MSIETIVGPMFSGKTSELIRRLTRSQIAKKRVVVFKPDIDTRWVGSSNTPHILSKTTTIRSHSGAEFTAFSVSDSKYISSYLSLSDDDDDPIDVVGIDEVQFFDSGVVDVINIIASKGIRVMVSGLDMDFKGDPFSVVPLILAYSDRVDKIPAICSKCGCEEGTRTQRLVGGVPASRTDALVVIGAEECYEARCRKCHIVR